MTNRSAISILGIRRTILAAALTTGLLLFLVAIRIHLSSSSPLLTIRSLDSIQPVSLPAPPPPPSPETPPPPPDAIELPKLKIEIDSVAPPVKASLTRDLELKLNPSEFAPVQDAPLAQMTFSSVDLDSQPKLVNKPTFTFPSAQRKKGITQAKVVLEVMISSSGTVAVQRVLESPHDDFTQIARSFATRARFTPPKKDGRSVQALFRWPLTLKL
ncbi:MAG: TonB family protein [Verrucomicrobiales bacterium]|jgi:TonB family protein|nr:TonB family protein [Verrucomicrobiales bacterium]